MQQQTQEFLSIRAAVADIEAQAVKRRGHYEDEITRLNAEINNLRSHSVPPPSALGMSGVTLPSISMRERGDGPVGPPPGGSSGGLQSMQQPPYPREYERRDDRELDIPAKRTKHEKKEPPGGGIGRGPPADYHSGPPPPPSSMHKSPPSRSNYLPPEQTPRPSSAVVRPKEEFPGDLDPSTVPAEYRKDGDDWFALYNPRVPQSLDVNLVHQFNHESVVCCVRFSKDGLWLATGCNRTAQIFDMRTGTLSCTLNDESVPQEGDLYIRAVCFSPDGKWLATGAEDRLIRVRFHSGLPMVFLYTDVPCTYPAQIWDIARKRIRYTFEGHQQEIYSLDFSHDGSLIVSGSGDKTARIWDMNSRESKVLPIDDDPNVDAGVTSVAISPDARFVAAGSLDTVVRIWDVATGTLVDRLRGHGDSVYSVAFTPDGKGLVSGSLDKTLKYWELNTAISNARKAGERFGKSVLDFTGHKDYVLSVAISHDGQWVVSGSKDRSVQFWDKNGRAQLMLQGHKNSGVSISLCYITVSDTVTMCTVISIDLSPTGGYLATGSGDWQARVCKSHLLIHFMSIC